MVPQGKRFYRNLSIRPDIPIKYIFTEPVIVRSFISTGQSLYYILGGKFRFTAVICRNKSFQRLIKLREIFI